MFDFLFDKFPWLPDFLALAAGLGLIAFMVYWARGAGKVGRGFVIRVDPEEVSFSGDFPPGMQGMVTDFLRNDIDVGGTYEVRGYWDRESTPARLVVAVKGEEARVFEQRIRNFLKLNLKPPRA
jgi:hypothetical protein